MQLFAYTVYHMVELSGMNMFKKTQVLEWTKLLKDITK